MEYIIYRDGLKISKIGDNTIDGRGANNVPFKVVYNGSGTDEFSSYEIQLHYSYTNLKKHDRFVVANSDGTFLIPKEAFDNGGNLQISLKFVKDKYSRTTINSLNYRINNNPNGSESFSETEGDTVKEIVERYLDELFFSGGTSLAVDPTVDGEGNIKFNVVIGN